MDIKLHRCPTKGYKGLIVCQLDFIMRQKHSNGNECHSINCWIEVPLAIFGRQSHNFAWAERVFIIRTDSYFTSVKRRSRP